MNPIPLFHTLIGDSVEGPFTAGQLRAMEESGVIHSQTPISRQGEAEWLPLEVWREVIHGAPTHRGAAVRIAPTKTGHLGQHKGKGQGNSAATGKATSLRKAALTLALLGAGLAIASRTLPATPTWAWPTGLTSLALAALLWLLTASTGRE